MHVLEKIALPLSKGIQPPPPSEVKKMSHPKYPRSPLDVNSAIPLIHTFYCICSCTFEGSLLVYISMDGWGMYVLLGQRILLVGVKKYAHPLLGIEGKIIYVPLPSPCRMRKRCQPPINLYLEKVGHTISPVQKKMLAPLSISILGVNYRSSLTTVSCITDTHEQHKNIDK